MNNEIREILNQLEYFNEEDYKYYSDFKLNRNQIKQLLDYITNLQEENKRLKVQLDYLETYSSKEDVYEDMSRRLNRIEKIIGENNDK